LAKTLAHSIVLHLDTCSAADFWALFVNTKVRGGVIARTVLIAAKQLSDLPNWSGAPHLLKRKQELIDQKALFLSWADNRGVIEWLRLQVYTLVRTNQRTHKLITVHHAGIVANTDGIMVSAASVQATENCMARIAHLACDPRSRIILNVLFGVKNRENLEGDLTPEALWNRLADVFVNCANWDIATISVAEVSSIEVEEAPFAPGVLGSVVKDIFTELKSEFSRLCTKIL
jgi:hypothetical protein